MGISGVWIALKRLVIWPYVGFGLNPDEQYEAYLVEGAIKTKKRGKVYPSNADPIPASKGNDLQQVGNNRRNQENQGVSSSSSKVSGGAGMVPL